MKKLSLEEKEIFSLLTSKQIAEISEIAVIKDFEEGQIVYDQKETAKNLFILLEGEVSLRIQSKNDMSIEKFSLEKDTYDIVITDKTMPEMTGYDLALKIREIRPDIPIVLCTGFLDKDDEDKVNGSDIDAVVMKPFDKKQMAETIRLLLDNKGL